MVELPGRRLTPANDTFVAPVEEVERGELAPAEAGSWEPTVTPAVTESVTETGTQPQSVTETVTEDVAPPTETPPLPTQNYERMFEDMNPELKAYKQRLRALETDPEEAAPAEDLPDPIKRTMADAKKESAREQGRAKGIEVSAGAEAGGKNVPDHLANQAAQEKAKKDADDTWSYLTGLIERVNPLSSEKMFAGVLMIPEVVKALGISGPEDESSEYMKGVRTGAGGTQSMVFSGLAQYAATQGNDDAKLLYELLARQGREEMMKSKQMAPRVRAFADIKSEAWFKDLADYISFKAGEAAGNLAPTIAAMTAMGPTGGVGFLYTMSLGEVRDNLIEAGVTDENKIATYAYPIAAGVAALDSLFSIGVMKSLTGEARKKVVRGITQAFIRGAARGSILEGTTEMLQEALQLAGVSHAKDGTNVFTQEGFLSVYADTGNLQRLFEAGVGGALGGAQFGGPARAVENIQRQQQLAAKGRGLFTPSEGAPSPTATPEAPAEEEPAAEPRPQEAAPPVSDNPAVEEVRERQLGRMEPPEAPAEAAPAAEEALPVGEEPPPITEIPEAPEAPEDIIQAAQEVLGDDFADAEPRQIAEAVGQAADLAEENIPDLDAVIEMVDYVRQAQSLPQPTRLSQYLVDLGGVQDEGGDIRSIMGGTRSRPGLVSGRGVPLDEAALRAWEQGFLPGADRPDINVLKAALQEDLGTAPRFSEIDADRVADLNTAEEMRQGLEQLGITINDSPEVIEQKLAAARQGAQNLRDTADAAVAAVEQIEERAQAEAAREVTDEDRQRFNDVLAGKAVRSKWAETAGVTEEQLATLIEEALADGRLQMRGDKPVRARKRIEAQESARLVEMAQERSEDEPKDLSPDLAAGNRVLALPTSFQRNYARALFKAGVDEFKFRQALAAIRDDENMTAAQVVEIAAAYVGRRPGAVFRQRRTAIAAMTAEFNRRAQAVERAAINGTSLEVEGANLALNEDVRSIILQMADRIDPGQTFGVEIRETLSAMAGETVAGLYDPAKNLVAIALEYGKEDALSTFTHEVVHALRQIGLLKGKDWDVLTQAANRKPPKREALRILKRLEDSRILLRARANELRAKAGELTYRELYDIDRRYTSSVTKKVLLEQSPEQLDEYRESGKPISSLDGEISQKIEELLVEESVAHIAEDWNDGRDHGSRVERVMNRIQDFIEALKNFFEFGSLQSVNQVFDNVFSGEISRQAMAEFATKRRGGGSGQWQSPKFRGVMSALRAWHGSPFAFVKFSMDKLGSNDGQAYGYGIYFAENINTAKSYMPRDFDLEKWAYNQYQAAEAAEDYYLMEAWERIMMHETPAELREFAAEYADDPSYVEAFNIVADLTAKRLSQSTASLYNVTLHVEPEELIDWDAPVSEQPAAVQEVMNKLLGMSEETRQDWRDRIATDLAENGPLGYPEERLDRVLDEAFRYGGYGPEFGTNVWDEVREASPNLGNDFVRAVSQSGAGLDPDSDIGATLYNAVASNYTSPHDIMAAFLEIGVKGIQFWDQGSRAAGDGTRNYVIFDTNLIEIHDRNGIPADSDARAGVLNEMEVGEDPDIRGRQMFSRRLRAEGYVPIEDIPVNEAVPHPSRVIAYHATASNTDFDRFDITYSDDIGTHFGSAEQASDRVGDGSYWGGPPRIFPVGIEIKNPLTLPDMGGWEPRLMWKALMRRGIVPQFEADGTRTALEELVLADAEEYIATRLPPMEEYASRDEYYRDHDRVFREFRQMQYTPLREAIEAAGYDGIRYLNEHEGIDHDNPVAFTEDGEPSGGWAYIVWRPGQVTSATTGRVMLSKRAADPGLLENGDHVDRISTRFPTQVQSTEDPLAELLVIDQNAMRADDEFYKFNAGIVRGYVNWPKSNRDRNPDKVFDAFKEQIKSNLLWLYNQVPPEIREKSKNWYDGARAITEQWSEDFNQPPRVIAGVLAALSPGKDWYANVSMAERMLDIWTYKQDHKWDAKMTRTANRIVSVDKETGEEKTLVKPELLKQIKGKTLAELVESGNEDGNFQRAAAFIRVYDETYNDGMLRVVAATGEFIGDPQQKINWQSYSLIAKAVSVLNDPSLENISKAMGGAHKIRNFYNNILAPNARFGDVTIDTHAIAAALLRALAQKSTEVAHGLGSATAKGVQNVKHVGLSGTKGLYGIYADAYREAAQELQILPRELQSITWEAVRGLFPRSWKTEENVAAIDAIWEEYRNGRISIDEARSRILDAAGGIEDPSWYRSDSAVAVEQFDTSYEGELSRARVSGRPAQRVRSAAGRGGGGRSARGAATRQSYSLREPVIDQLGFYSAAIEAAYNLKQEKGTPEQMLSQLAKNGARKSEIAHYNLEKIFEGRKSVTKDEIIEILEIGRIRLREQVRETIPDEESKNSLYIINVDNEQISIEEAISRISNEADRLRLEAHWDLIKPGERLDSRTNQGKFIQGELMPRLRVEMGLAEPEWTRVNHQWEVLQSRPRPKWSTYSLDRGNPTYKETTIYLPPAPQSLKFEVEQDGKRTYVDDLKVEDWPVFGEGMGDDRFVGKALWAGREEVSGVKQVTYRIGDASPIDGDITYWPTAPRWPNGVFTVSSLNIQNAQFGTLEEAKQYIEADYRENRETLQDRSDVYMGTHFPEPNIVVHLRTAEHPDREGNRHLVLQEQQSDMGQDYRDYVDKQPEPQEVEANLNRLKYLTSEYDRVSKVWYDLQQSPEQISEWGSDISWSDIDPDTYDSMGVRQGFPAPLREDAVEFAKRALAQQDGASVEEIEDVLYGYEDPMDYVDYWTAARARLHAEINQSYNNNVNNPDFVNIARQRKEQAWNEAVAAVNKDRERQGQEPVNPNGETIWKYLDWAARYYPPTHPVARAYNTWYILDIQFWNVSDASQPPGSVQVPHHVLIENTDNWVNLGLRRLLIQAVDAGVDYIAIASGESVDSLKMGTPITGALYAYNVMYPKKMRDILKKIDKEAATPEKVKTLLGDETDVEAYQQYLKAEEEARRVGQAALPPFLNEYGNTKEYKVHKSQERQVDDDSGEWLWSVFINGKMITDPKKPVPEAEADELVAKWEKNLSGGYGFTRFKITDKVREAVKQRGLPMLSKREGPPPGQTDLFDAGINEDVHRQAAIANGFDTDRVLWRSTVDTGGNMGTGNVYLHGSRPSNDPDAVPVWVRTTTERKPGDALVPSEEYTRAFNAQSHNSMGAVDPDTARRIIKKINRDFTERGYIGTQLAIKRKEGKGYVTTVHVAMFDSKDILEVAPSYRGSASLREQRKEPPVLNRIIANLKNTLGITTSQTMFGVDIYVGEERIRLRPPKNMRSQYRRDTGSVGVRASRDIKAIARAGGFALQRMVGQPLTEIQELHRDELVPAQMLAPPSQEVMSEAFSRFFERYVMDREGARQMAPNFFEAFEEVLDAEQPTILQEIDVVTQGYREWSERASVDELASDLVSVYSESDWKTINDQARNFSRTTPGRMATAWTAIVDDQAPIKQIVRRLLGVADQNGVRDENGRPISLKVQENAYKLARMFRGAHATGYSYLTKGIPNYRGAVAVYAPLSRAMDVLFGGKQWTEQEYKDFGQYLVARRAVAEYDRLAEKEDRLADLDNMIEAQRELARQARDNYTKIQNRLQSRQRGMSEREAQLRIRERDLRQVTREEDRLQQRLADLSNEIADAADIIERFEIDRDTIDAQLEGMEGQLSPEIMNTLRNLAEGVEDTRGSMQRLTNRRRQLERDAARVRTRRERLQQEVDALSTDAAFLRAEINQLLPESEIAYSAAMQDEGDLVILRDERKRVQKLGASRPPTLESREHWVNYISKMEADPRFANIQEASQIVYEFNFGLLTLRYQAGLVPEDQYELLAQRRDYYVPFMRDMSDIPGQSIFNASGSGRSWSPFKKFDGSDRAIINPLEAMSQEAYRTAQHIAMNDIIKSIAGLAERAGEGAGQIAQVLETRTNEPEAFDRLMDYAIQFGVDPADALQMVMQMEVDWTNADLDVIWRPTGTGPVAPPTVPIWIGGRRTFVQFNDPDFGQDAVNALKGLGQEQINWWLDTFAGTPSRILQIGVTTHPTFMPRNLIRDIFDAWIKVGALPVLTQIEGAKLMYQDWMGTSDFMRQYMAEGGIVGGRNVAAMTQKEQQLKVLDLDPNRTATSAIAMGSIAGAALGTIIAGPIGGLFGAALMGYGTRQGQVLKMVESVETMTRIGVAAHAYREAKKNAPNLSEQEAIAEAAFVARDIFDWNRRGSKTLPLLRMVTFLNAQIQGMARAAEGLGGTGDRGSAMARVEVARHMSIVFKRENAIDLSADEVRDLTNAYKTWGRMGLYTLSLLSLYALFADDDDYEDVLDRSKFTHTWLPDVFGVDIRIPKAFEWAVPANIIEVLWDGATGRDPQVAERLVQSTYEVLVPPALPQFYTLATGYLTGQNVSDIQGRNRSIVPSWEAGRAPELQFNAYTSRLARDVANAMVAVGIPDSKVPAPYMIDFTLRSGGYWGQDLSRAYDYAREAITGEPGLEPRVFQWPVIGGFTGATARTSRSIDQYYKMMSRNGGNFYLQARRYRDYIKDEGSPEDAAIALTRMSKDEKSYALVEFHGSANDKRTHPLNRLEKINGTIAKVSRDIIANKLTPGKRRGRNLAEVRDNIVQLDPKTKTAIIDTLEKLRRAEGWNTMAYMNQPGWAGKKERDVEAIMKTLEAVSPDAHGALLDRMREAKVLEWDRVKERWPSVEQRILRRFGAGPE